MSHRNFDINRLNREIARERRYVQSVAPAAGYDRIFKQAAEAHRKKLQQLSKLPTVDQDRVRSMLEPAQEAIKRNLQGLVEAIQQKLDLRNLVPSVRLIPQLPNLSEMVDLQGLLRKAAEAAQRTAEATAEGDETLEASGFGFADHLWKWGFVASFAHIDPKVRDAVVTNRLAAEMRSEEFEEWLEEEIAGSRVMAHRWEIVRQSLETHRRREYLLSVPALLAQVEGLVGDALILKNFVSSDGHKLYRLGPGGSVELDKKGNPVELRGISQLLHHSGFHSQAALNDAVAFLTNSLIPSRNAILHGRNTSYGKAKLSVQALLMVLVLAVEIRAFEEGRLPSSPAPYRLLSPYSSARN